MTPQDLIALRARLGWDRTELARQLGISPSRLKDYELGQTRGEPPRPAPIPKLVELACRWLEEHTPPQPLTPKQKAALWSDPAAWPRYDGPPLPEDVFSRENLYDEPAS
jgi:transcriptional regulator with XRE-family HTH domain